MNETLVTVVGNVATAPVVREFATGRVVRFRLAATARYWDRRSETWADGHTNFFTVCAWRALAENAMASLSVGEPVIVQGRLKVRQEDGGDGKQWFAADIEASSIGHDLARGTAAFQRVPPVVRQRGAADGFPQPRADGDATTGQVALGDDMTLGDVKVRGGGAQGVPARPERDLWDLGARARGPAAVEGSAEGELDPLAV
ncbi:single-stranded DNA-binding protein [Streptomyces sp. NPDC005955]|uniref:single-stranded DNA-binding protein n=1 Tax=Streptomyces sp. NPDC005955 TaxID=3364738 RepID=UPI003675C468